MSNTNINFKLGFDLDAAGIQQARTQIENLIKELEKKPNFQVDEELQKAKNSAQALDTALQRAYNKRLDTINVETFNKELRKANTNLRSVEQSLTRVGVEGTEAFNNIQYQMDKVGLQTRQTGNLLTKMFQTFGETVRWGISSSVFNTLVNTAQRAVGFTKALDESLNNIRVVSGKNAEQMKAFAKEANEAAKALGKSTTEYTDASLIYYQQGKKEDEVRALTEATLAGANVTGTEVTKMADLLTAVMNGYKKEASEAMNVTDKLAAVGAATGSDFEELASGMSRVASVANQVGVSIDSLNAQIATITTVTREAPESIGVALKTIYSRMAEIKVAGKITDEEGLTYTTGNAEKALQSVGLTVLDQNGHLREMEEIITDIGNKWVELGDVEKQAVAEAMAGKQQVNKFISLFDNWEMYNEALKVSLDSVGATMEQNEIRQDSLYYKTRQMTANLEKLWQTILDENVLKTMVSALDGLIVGVDKFINSLGGISGSLSTLGGLGTAVFSKQIAGSLINSFTRVKNYYDKQIQPLIEKRQNTVQGSTIEGEDSNNITELSASQSAKLDLYTEIAEMKQQEYRIEKELGAAQHEQYKQLKLVIAAEGEANIKAIQRLEKAKEIAEEAKLEGDIRTKNVKDRKAELLAEQEHLQKLKTAWEEMKENQGGAAGGVDNTDRNKLIKSLEEQGIDPKLVKTMNQRKQEKVYGLFPNEQLDGRIGRALRENRAQLEAINKLQEQGLANAQEEADVQEEINVKIAGAAREDAARLEKLAKRQEVIRKTVSYIGTGVALLSSATGAVKAFFEAEGDFEAQTEAISNGLKTIGTSLMMMPGLWTKVIGLTSVALGVFSKYVREHSILGQALKNNEEAIERYKERTSELTSELSTFEKQQKSLKEMQNEIALVGGDITRLTVEQQESYKNLGNQIAQTAPEMIAYYTKEGDAILKTTANLQEYIDKKKEALQLERDAMVANKGSFLTEYSYDLQNNEEKIKTEQAKVDRLKNELETLKANGASTKKINKKESELNTAIQAVSDLKQELVDLDKNIQENIINPFILSEEKITSVADSLKMVVSASYDLEDVQNTMKKYQYYWDVVGGIPTKVKRSYEEMAQLATEELEKMERQTRRVATALVNLQEKAKPDTEEAKEYRTLYNNLIKADDATKTYIGNVLQLGLAANSTNDILQTMAKNVDEFGVALAPNISDFWDTINKDAKNTVDNFAKNMTDLTVKMAKAREELGNTKQYETAGLLDWSSNPDINAGMLLQRDNDLYLNQEYSKKQQEIADLEEQRIELNSRLVEAKKILNDQAQEALSKQKQLNIEYEKYLMDLASTPEGMNKLIDSYNAQYEKFKQINELMNQGGKTTEKVSVEQENGLMGEPVEIEVENFEDSAVGQFFYDFENAVNNIVSSGMPSLEDALNNISIGDGPLSAMEQMKEYLAKIPQETLSSFKGMNKQLDKDINEVIQKGNKASAEAAKNVGVAVNQQQQALGRMYAAINKDNTTYFENFKKQNTDQMKLVGLATGVMANDYATYAEYTADLDKWMAENSTWLANEQVSSKYWTMIQAIQAAQEEGQAYDIISGEMVETSNVDSAARAEASKAAAFAAVAAEAEAGLQRAEITKAGIEQAINTAQGNSKISAAVVPILEQDLAEMEADIEKYKAIMELYEKAVNDAKSKIDINTTNTTGGGGGGGLGNFNYSAGGGSVPKKPVSSSQPNAPTGAGATSSGSSSKEKEVEDLEWEKDIYHDINVLIKQKQILLDKLQKQQDKLYGKELLNNLAQQKKLLQEQQKLYEQKLQMQKQDLADRKKFLQTQGVTFNVDGTISNYNQLLEKKVAYVNSLSGEAKEAAKEEFSKLVELMEHYETLMLDTITETENTIQDLIDKQREIFLQEFEYAINLKIEISKDSKEALDFLKQMNTEYEDMSDNYERTKEQMAEQLDLVNRLTVKLQEIQKGDFTEKERLELLEKYNAELKNAVKTLKDLDKELTTIFKNTLKDGTKILSDHISEYKTLNEQLKHYEQTLKLIGETENYDTLNKIYEAQYANLLGQINVNNKQLEALKAQKKALEEAGKTGSDEWKEVDSAIKSTQKTLNSLAQETLKLLQTEFKNSANEILDILTKAMTGGSTISDLKKEQQNLRKEKEAYLNNEKKLLEISKLQQKINKEIAETNSPQKQAQLKKFMEIELAFLKNKEKLSKSDVERANTIYDLLLKQMALEEQRDNKNILRLVRNSQGNWVYQFTEDAEAIQKAEEDVSDALEKLMTNDEKRFKESQDKLMTLYENFEKDYKQLMTDAANGKFKTEEEFRQKMKELSEKYNKDLLQGQKEYEEAKENYAISSIANILDVYTKTGQGLEDLTDKQKYLFSSLAAATKGDFLLLQDSIEKVLTGDVNSIWSVLESLGLNTADALEKLGINVSEEMKNMTEITKEDLDKLGINIEDITGEVSESVLNLIKDMNEGWGTDISDMISKFVGEGGFEEEVGNAIDNVIKNWNEYQEKIKETQEQTGTSLDKILSDIKNVDKATVDLNNTTNNLINKFKEEMDAVVALTASYEANRQQINKNIQETIKYIDSINKVIDAIKRKNDTESNNNKPATTTTTTTKPATTTTTTTTKPATSTGPQGNGKIDIGDKVKVKNSNAKAWYTATGTQVANWSAQAAAVGKKWNDDFYIFNQYGQRIALSATKGAMALAWVDKNDITGYKTGGFTGSWGEQGKLGILHEKELVLNKDDTKNLLDTVKILRGDLISKLINSITTNNLALSYQANNLFKESKNLKINKEKDIKQTVNINADFSGVRSSIEIERAFENMSNMASQYVSRR